MNIVITGASKGIGFEAALRLNTDPNNKIVAIARSKSLLENLKQTCKYT
jgi:short-subunit dehydrogenase